MSEFEKNRGRRDGLQAHCRACRVTLNRLSHARHKETLRGYKKKFRLRNKLRVLEYLRRHSCVDCGETDPVVLEFDHQGEKREDIASMVRWQTSWKAMEKEISRCQVRCANCHRRKTARERGWFRSKARDWRLEAGGSNVVGAQRAVPLRTKPACVAAALRRPGGRGGGINPG